MRRKRAILAPLVIALVLSGCTGPVAPDEPGTDRPTVTPAAPDAAPLAGTTWGEKPFLTFNSDGTYVGNAGCNGISGDWEQEGGTVTFGSMATTDIACQDSPDWAMPPASATVTDDSLTLLDADGGVIDELAARD